MFDNNFVHLGKIQLIYGLFVISKVFLIIKYALKRECEDNTGYENLDCVKCGATVKMWMLFKNLVNYDPDQFQLIPHITLLKNIYYINWVDFSTASSRNN
jgi:hypothetical protein